MIDKLTTNDGRGLADLLPWYETGRLADADRRRVAESLERDGELRCELQAVRDERAAAIAANEAISGPSRQGAERFLAALDASPRHAPPRARFAPIRWLADWLDDLQPRTIAWGALAALVVVVLQAGLISAALTPAGEGWILRHRDLATYRTASVPAAPADKAPDLLVAFVPTATAAGIQRLLDDGGLTIVGGPAAGYYDIHVARRDPRGIDAVVDRLRRSKDIVRTVMSKSKVD